MSLRTVATILRPSADRLVSGTRATTTAPTAWRCLASCDRQWTWGGGPVQHFQSPPNPDRPRGLHSTSRPAFADGGGRNVGQQRSQDEPGAGLESLDVLSGAPAPANSVDACLADGFRLSNGITVRGGTGVLLVNGDAFAWTPWGAGCGGARLLNAKGQWEVDQVAFGLLSVVWPRPDLLLLGLGGEMRPLSPVTRRYLSSLGVRVEVLDTRNASAQFNLLATERGSDQVAAALVPMGWTEG